MFLVSRMTAPPQQQYARTASDNELSVVYVDIHSGVQPMKGRPFFSEPARRLPAREAVRQVSRIHVADSAEMSRDVSDSQPVADKTSFAHRLSGARPDPDYPRTADRHTDEAQPSSAAQAFSQASIGLNRSAQPLGHINVSPEYPPQARRRGWEGRVVLRVRVEADGRISDMQLQSSSGRPVLDQAALDSVATWQYRSAVRNGIEVASWISQAVEFRLHDRNGSTVR